MLEGIQILNETIIFSARVGHIISAVFLCLISILILILSIVGFKKKEYGAGVLCVILFFFFSYGTFSSVREYRNTTSYKEYQVTISETVKIIEFNEKYEILRQDGKIFTIIEKMIK